MEIFDFDIYKIFPGRPEDELKKKKNVGIFKSRYVYVHCR